jgi:hypothetical protein
MELRKETFINAYRNISFSPEKRGESDYKEFSAMLSDDLSKLGDNQGNYARKYQQRLSLYLARKSRTASAMICGPAKFPFRQNAKKIDAEMRAWSDFMKWREKYIKASTRERTKSPEEEIDSALADIDRMNTGHALLKELNKLKTIEERKAFLVEHQNHLKGIIRIQIDLKDDLKCEHWTLTYLKRKIKAREDKLAINKNRIEVKENFETLEYPNGKILIENDRVIISHDVKPSREVIEKIKARGFRWSPSYSSWSRKHTANALYDAKEIMKGE